MNDPRPRIVVVGLGPGGESHVTRETLDAVDRIEPRFLRTSVHPTAHLVPDATSFDDVYEAADRFDDVYEEIVERLVASAVSNGAVLYAVPGSPLVLERTVRLLLDDERVTTEVLPAMSFLDLVWARLGIDPVEAGVRLVDGHEFARSGADASGPLLVAHTHANWVLSDIKLSIDDVDVVGDAAGTSLAETPVTLLQALGTEDERIVTTTWADMDRALEADHLTSLYVPELGAHPGLGYVRFHDLARTLRERCPWDIEQTHTSLVPYLIEESYELVDAIQGLDPDDPASDEHLIEELGDLLYQIEFHATIAEQEGRFSIADVTSAIHDKLVRRHPHVFGDVDVEGSDDVLANWEAIKRAEKGRTSVFDGVAGSLPSLSYAHQVQRKAAKVGFDWPSVDGALPKIAEEAAELADALGDDDESRDELGDLLFAVVNVARHLRVDPEAALRAAADKFRRRFESVELLAAERSIDLHDADLGTLDALWDEIKRV
ncbi:MAG: nucleoside triphosphate pyrophosphohydrolase [Ilumatobacter sp.]|uniref:nucleoside triphosphate pyrophosphohydrolase n=1 Tax=Ilumatobacter sp. TaxID=1967498 RepID=UPI002632DB15|nr:nucleoside triphosphate pyrophosphohydrolase [Ilumatobacter sp.]MDJ0768854.1 nucleoside triphosphate pyrophosphohydrolase [Ilumatobacter sp.]